MIKAQDFLNLLKGQGYNFFTGVACSYLTELINLICADDDITYIAATNEGDAVGIAAGAYLGGNKPVVFMQNSGLGNAVNPITSLLQPFNIPLLFLITHRGDPNQAADEPQHRLMGSTMLNLLDQMKIQHVDLTPDVADLNKLVADVTSAVEAESQSYAFVIKKGCFDNKGAVDTSDVDTTRHVRRDVLAFIQQQFSSDDSIVLATTGYTGRELYALDDRANQFYMVGSMGCISSIGLGLALEHPDKKIIVIDGDGAAMMRMGAMATIGHYQPANLLHVLLDNGVYESTGAQATVADSVDFALVARGCGYTETFDVDDYNSAISDWQSGLRFVYIKTQTIKGKVNYPRPTVTPAEVALRVKALLKGVTNEVA
jgi:phosphonopyruvate decarboxylase